MITVYTKVDGNGNRMAYASCPNGTRKLISLSPNPDWQFCFGPDVKVLKLTKKFLKNHGGADAVTVGQFKALAGIA